MTNKLVFFLTLAMALCGVEAKPGQPAFQPVPKQALTELKATVGKPFSKGLVFINGRFIQPPYKVERYGTAMRINGQQVTGQVIPWSEFLKTQDGVKIEKTAPAEAPASDSEETSQDASEETDGSEQSSDSESYDSLDDLFSDSPAPKKTVGQKKPSRRPAAAAPAPEPAVTVTLDGEFKSNEKVRLMVAKLNKYRANIEVTLRKGGYIFFGSRYSSVIGDRGTIDLLVTELPAAMKKSAEYSAFASAARSGRLGFLPEEVLRDLFRNRIDYLRLEAWAKKMEEERQWNALMENAL
jgi:hypothetical protein